MIEQTDLEDICSLQFIQWTVMQYCTSVLERLVPCLKTTNEGLSLHCLQLIHHVVALIKTSLAPEELWDDTSFPAQEVVS